jgi:excisionase family DNA binding protein
VEEINKELDAGPKRLPDHVHFKITAKTYSAEMEQTYPLRYTGNEFKEIAEHYEVTLLFAVSPITLYKMAKSGRLPSYRIGAAVRFDTRAIAGWLRGRSEGLLECGCVL